ncbi:MAG: elongation factor P [candidate division NC10 bacterium]|nr:elongation factor P [candidate division NC10 bacterium]
MISAIDLRPGVKIEIKRDPYMVVDYQHVKPGKGGAFMRTKLKNMRTGALVDKTFRSEEKVPLARIEERHVQYLYRRGADFYFMDLETFEQFFMNEGELDPAKGFLKEGLTITILFHQGKPVGVELPLFVELTVARTDPGVRGDTASGGSKPATLETGAVIQVPLFIQEGDRIRVDTRTRTYVERV